MAINWWIISLVAVLSKRLNEWTFCRLREACHQIELRNYCTADVNSDWARVQTVPVYVACFTVWRHTGNRIREYTLRWPADLHLRKPREGVSFWTETLPVRNSNMHPSVYQLWMPVWRSVANVSRDKTNRKTLDFLTVSTDKLPAPKWGTRLVVMIENYRHLMSFVMASDSPTNLNNKWTVCRNIFLLCFFVVVVVSFFFLLFFGTSNYFLVHTKKEEFLVKRFVCGYRTAFLTVCFQKEVSVDRFTTCRKTFLIGCVCGWRRHRGQLFVCTPV